MIIRKEFSIYGRMALEVTVDELMIKNLKERFKTDTYFTNGNGHKANDALEITEDTIKSVLRCVGWLNERPTEKDKIVYYEEVLCENDYYPNSSICDFGELLKEEIDEYIADMGEEILICYENDGMWSETYIEEKK